MAANEAADLRQRQGRIDPFQRHDIKQLRQEQKKNKAFDASPDPLPPAAFFIFLFQFLFCFHTSNTFIL